MLHPCTRPFARGTPLICCLLLAINLLSIHAFQCGAPLAPCGEAVPAGVICPKGAGWCTAGHYCGYAKGQTEAQCVPLPMNCGKAGSECCPSNADTPHTSSTDALERRPFCKDGSTCVFDPMGMSTSATPDKYAGVKGYACIIPGNCGTTPNSPCCPTSYRIAFNPRLSKGVCPDDFFCDYDEANARGKFPGIDLLPMPPGVCLRNAPDCGKVGKPCCISNGGSSTVITCSPDNEQQGYCAAKDGRTTGVDDKDLVCQLCPATGGPSGCS